MTLMLGMSALPTVALAAPVEPAATQLDLSERQAPLSAKAETLVGARKVGENLRKQDFAGQDMRHINMHHAALHDANMQRANMHHANLHHAQLHRANMHHANLHHANMQSANMHHATMHYANLHHADMRDAVMHHANLHHANFTSAKLHRTDFRHAVVHHGVFDYANLQDAQMHYADLSNASMSPAQLKHANLTGASLHHSKLAGSSFHHAIMQRVNLSHADLTGAIMHNADMHQATLNSATMHQAKIHNAKLTEAKLKGVKARKGTWFGTSFEGANLSGSDLSKGKFSKLSKKNGEKNTKGKSLSAQTFCPSCSSFAGANLSGVNFSGANLAGVDFTNANLSGANLSNASLMNAILTGANLAGANLTGTKMTTAISETYDASILCGAMDMKATNATISSGVVATYSVGLIGGQGNISIAGPNGATLTGTFSCVNTSWTITITGSSGYTPIVNGMTAGSFTGTITKTGTAPAEWNVTASASIVRNGITVSGKLTLQGNNRWILNASAASGSVTDTTGTYSINSATGNLVYNAYKINGTIDLNLSNGGIALSKLGATLPAGWTTNSKFHLAFSSSGLLLSDVVPTMKVEVFATSASGADSISFNGDWSPSGYSLTGSGTFKVKGQSMNVSGSYQSVGYVPTGGTALKSPTCSISVSVSNVGLGNGAKLDNGTITAVCGTPGLSGTVTLVPELDSSARLIGTLSYVNSSNWVFTMGTSTSATSWSPKNLSGLSIDPSKITGTVTSAAGNVTWALTIGSVTWNNMVTGVTTTTGFTVGNTCPVTSCGTASGLFLTLVNAQAAFPSPIGNVPLSGAVSADGTWGYIQSASNGSLSFTGPGGGSASLSSPTVTMWKGTKPTSAAAGVNLPDLSSLDKANGWGVEFTGTLALKIPSLIDTSTTAAIGWTKDGIMIGMVGVGGTTSGTSGSNYSVGSTSFDGWAWTNLDLTGSMAKATLNNVQLAVTKATNNLTGAMSLPSNVMTALAMPSGATVPAIATVSMDGSVEDIKATLPMNIKTNGLQLVSIMFELGKVNTTYSVSLTAYGFADIDGHHIALAGGFRAATGGGLSFFLTATGTGGDSDPCACDGISTPFTSPQSSDKVYIVDNYLGMPGAHLWGITAQVQLVNGAPGLGINTSVYLDPSKSTALHGTTWMHSSFAANVSETDPCFKLGFSSNDPSTYLQVKGGVLQTQTFSLVFAPKGCTLGTDTIPAGASLMFQASFGNQSSLTIALAIGKDSSGAPTFTTDMAITGLVLNGITFDDVSLKISMSPTAQSMQFVGDFTTTLGSMNSTLDVSQDLTASACNKFVLDGDVTLTDWKLSSSDFDVNSMTYHMNVDSCGSFDTTASGDLNIGPKTALTFSGELKVDHGIMQIFDISFTYKRGSISQSFYLQYYKDQTACSTQSPCFNGITTHAAGTIDGGLSFSYEKYTSHKECSSCYKYERHVQVAIAINFYMDTKNPGNGKLTLAGALTADDLSGKVSCTISSGDDSCSASFSIKPSKTVSWSDSWNW